MIRKPELLCPAGSRSAFDAAIEAGADAIYLGLPSFNARINADNFTPADLGEAISRAHAYGVKVYITLNTLILDKEREDFLAAAKEGYLAGADAFIVADLGVARLLRKVMPNIPLHASTQLSGHNLAAAQTLADMGFTRMVCAREMSKEDLEFFVKNSPIEAEVFVHGALCVCQSGQCLFSSLVGGRSGNRGECAQPCRLPYSTPRGRSDYPLSLKDLSLAAYVGELIDMGVASFKIEGRMKSAEYVRDVTRIWRKLIDEHRGADSGELKKLAEIFSRGGFTDGYYTKKINGDMLGVRSDKDKLSTRKLDAFEGLTRKIPIEMSVSVKRGLPATLRIEPYGVSVSGAVPDEAINAPMSRESILKNISKLGATPYEAKKIDIELDGGLIMPLSALNSLRREAIDKISQISASPRSEAELNFEGVLAPRSKKDMTPTRSAVFYEPKNIIDAARDHFDIIYAPLHLYGGECNGVLLPAVIFDSEREEVGKMLTDAVRKGAKYALVGNIGHISLAREAGLIPHGDYRMNIMNSESALEAQRLGLCDLILSPELTLPQMRDIGGNTLSVVYGKVVLMTLEKCAIKEISSCEKCDGSWNYLVDRKDVRFPIRREYKHRNLIFNSIPFYMADRRDMLLKNKITGEHFIFSDESKKEIEAIIDAYRRCRPALNMKIRRIN